nr:MAG TPA: hypothetical protein [Caudoviricetes sp.]
MHNQFTFLSFLNCFTFNRDMDKCIPILYGPNNTIIKGKPFLTSYDLLDQDAIVHIKAPTDEILSGSFPISALLRNENDILEKLLSLCPDLYYPLLTTHIENNQNPYMGEFLDILEKAQSIKGGRIGNMIIFDIDHEEDKSTLILSIPNKLHEDLNYIYMSKDTRKTGKLYLYKNYFLAYYLRRHGNPEVKHLYKYINPAMFGIKEINLNNRDKYQNEAMHYWVSILFPKYYQETMNK